MSWRQTKAGEMAEMSVKWIYESVTTKRRVPYEKTEDYEMLIILVAYNTKYSEVRGSKKMLEQITKEYKICSSSK